jgi:hypothetical protein
VSVIPVAKVQIFFTHLVVSNDVADHQHLTRSAVALTYPVKFSQSPVEAPAYDEHPDVLLIHLPFPANTQPVR